MGPVTINFQNATLTSNTSQITLQNATFALSPNQPIGMAGTIAFQSLYMTNGSIDFNVQAGVVFTATVSAPVSSGSSGDPVLEVTNFSGTVTVSWPTSSGFETQLLMPGNPLTLTDFID